MTSSHKPTPPACGHTGTLNLTDVTNERCLRTTGLQRHTWRPLEARRESRLCLTFDTRFSDVSVPYIPRTLPTYTVDLANVDGLSLKQLLESHSATRDQLRAQKARHEMVACRLCACSPVATPMIPLRPARILAWAKTSSGAVGSSMNQRLNLASFLHHSMA